MANIGSLSGASSTSSIYGSRNVISGLASGLDTESMIANSVSGYKAKITSLQQQQTVLQWKQDAYRSITDKMIALTQKYTSYTSKTNLLSQSFFNRTVTTTPNGANAAAVTASGKTASSVQINSVSKLATAASYSVGAGKLSGDIESSGGISATTVDLNTEMELSTVSGTLTLNYGGSRTVNLQFGELETYEDINAFAAAIRTKLAGEKISNSEGQMVAASERIEVTVEDGTISFSDKANAGNSVYISGASGKLQEALKDIEFGTGATSFKAPDKLTEESGKLGDYLSGKEMTFLLDGVTKTIKLPTYNELPEHENGEAASFATELQKSLNAAFGENKITVDPGQSGTNLKLGFTISEGSTLSINSSVNAHLGLGTGEATSYLNTSHTLGSMNNLLEGLTATGTDGDNNEFYEFKINDVVIGNFTKDTSLESILLAINTNTEAGVSVSYSRMTDKFTFTAKETGAAGRIEFGDGLAQAMFDKGGSGANPATGFTEGTDATLNVTVNGVPMDLTRSSNVVDLDGLSVTLKQTFTEGEAITFTTKTDSDTVVDAVKSFVEDFNALITEIREGFNTQPARQSNGAAYRPLIDEDKASMSESAVKAYEEKAQQGLLFGDSDLSMLYNRLRSSIAGGSNGADLRSIGLTTAYSQGLTTLTLDESKLRDALETNPDRVKDIFTKTQEAGASTNGLMQTVKATLDTYASTSVATPGILVQKAGTKLSSLSLLRNSLQKNMDDLNTQIERWQTKMSGRVDYYTKKFTALERLISQMNSQSAYLFEMSGGY